MKLTPLTIVIYALAFVGARKLWLNYKRSKVTTEGGVAKEDAVAPKDGEFTPALAGKLAKRIWQNIKSMQTVNLPEDKALALRQENSKLRGILNAAGYNYKDGMAIPVNDTESAH